MEDSVQPRINLDNLTADAPMIEHGEKEYSLLTAKHLGVKDATRARKMGERLVKLGNQLSDIEPDSPEEEEFLKEFNSAWDNLTTLIIPSMSQAVKNDLDDRQKMGILGFFLEQSGRSQSFLRATLAGTSQGSPSGMG